MPDRIEFAKLKIDRALHDLTANAALPGTGAADNSSFGLATVLRDCPPKFAAHSKKRDELQAEIDAWHISKRPSSRPVPECKSFLAEIGCLIRNGLELKATTEDVSCAKASSR